MTAKNIKRGEDGTLSVVCIFKFVLIFYGLWCFYFIFCLLLVLCLWFRSCFRLLEASTFIVLNTHTGATYTTDGESGICKESTSAMLSGRDVHRHCFCI